MILVCWLNCFLRIITDWHEMLNELSFQMTIQVHICKDSFFIWLLVILWTFSQAFSQVIASSDFVCSSKSYFLTWNHTQTFIFCLYDILVMSECRAFHFITSQSTCSFNQQNYSCQFVVIILSWDHEHQFWFIIQIQIMNLVHMLCRKMSY